MRTRRSAGVSFLAGVLVAASIFGSAQVWAGTRWAAVGTRWAAEIDGDTGKTVALHDLSFPAPGGRVPIGRLEISEAALRALSAVIEEAAASGEGSERALRRARGALKGVGVAADWWRGLAWAPGRAPSDRSAPPARFRLDDLRIEDARGRALRLEDQLTAEQRDQLGAEGLPRDFSFSDFSLELETTREGGEPVYAIYWDPVVTEGDGPRKIIDLRRQGHFLARALAQDLLETAVTTLIGQIPVPAVSGLILAVVNTYFRYRAQLLKLHHAMAFEMIRMARSTSDLDGPAPFDFLDTADQNRAIRSLEYAQAAWSDLPLWIFTPPVTGWEKGRRKDDRTAGTNAVTLKTRGEHLDVLNGRFAIGTDREGRRRLYHLGKAMLLGNPSVAIDYDHPRTQTGVRVAVAAVSPLVEFITGFVPYVGGVLRWAYRQIVVNPINDRIRREAGLEAFLVEAGRDRDWSTELGIIESQRVNPLALDRERTAALIAARKAALGISAP